jgi:hypothetical protein
MTTQDSAPRPKQHVLADFGERFFAHALPPEWVVHAYRGSEDYGIDFHVEVFEGGRPAGLEFAAQVKTSGRGRPPSVLLTRNNIVYLAAKSYPSMIALVSRDEERATFSWFNEVLPPDRLLEILRGREQRSRPVRVNLTPSYDLRSSQHEIVNFLREHKRALLSWLEAAANARPVTQLYFDLHAALDALIDCLGVIHNQDRDPEMLSYKHTYTMILVFMAYQALYTIASRATVESHGPTATTLLAVQQRCRDVLSELVREPYLTQVEQSQEPVSIVPAALAPFWPAVPRFAILFRDALRVLAPLLAPWRDFIHGMSGLATFVMDSRTGTNIETADKPGA